MPYPDRRSAEVNDEEATDELGRSYERAARDMVAIIVVSAIGGVFTGCGTWNVLNEIVDIPLGASRAYIASQLL